MPRDAALNRRARKADASAAAKAEVLARSDSSAARDVAESLQDAMPKLLLRICITSLVLAIAAALAFALSPPGLSDSFPRHREYYDELRTVKYSQSLSQREATAPTVEVVAKYPHDAAAFTQGLVIVHHGRRGKFLIETTGLYGESSLRKVEIESGRVVEQYDLPSELFGEGVTLNNAGELVMLTWRSRKGFVFDLGKPQDGQGEDKFSLLREFEFATVTGEGWGIDNDGESLVVSDGSPTLLFWDPETMTETRRVVVTLPNNRPVARLNELEFANGYIYANVWYQPVILKIDPTTGAVVSVFDCSQLITDAGADVNSGAVLNGIAYDGEEDMFYITGKQWNALYKVRLLDSTRIDSL